MLWVWDGAGVCVWRYLGSVLGTLKFGCLMPNNCQVYELETKRTRVDRIGSIGHQEQHRYLKTWTRLPQERVKR